MSKPDLGIIRQSARKLAELADKHYWDDVHLSKVGCERGGLRWEDVSAELEEVLDDRFTVADLVWLEEEVDDRFGLEEGVVRVGSKLSVVFSPKFDMVVDAKVLMCFDKKMEETSVVNLANMKKNESLFVATDSAEGGTALLSIGPFFERNKDYVVAIKDEA
jgi:hypothetical protein